ncbi:MAG: hypothetical protein Q9187_000063 [Circinaria calcarea]
MEQAPSSPPRMLMSFGSPGPDEAPRPLPRKIQDTPSLGYKDADNLPLDASVDKSPRRSKLRSLASLTKAKPKQLRNLASRASSALAGDHGEPEPLHSIHDDAAFNPGTLANRKTFSPGVSANKTREVLQSITTTIAHPRRTTIRKVKKATARTLSSVQGPHLSHREELEFLEAHDNLSRAEFTKSSRQSTSDDKDEDDAATNNFRDKISALEEHRESRRVAWTTNHINRVRVVPKGNLKFPDHEAFVERDDSGSQVRYRWEKWLGHILIFYTQGFSAQYIDEFDDLPYDIDTLRHHVERIVLASAPWQTWAMDVRSIYRWENPIDTGKWLVLYIVLWSTEHVVGFLWLYIIYLVAKNRYFPTSVESLRDSIRRALDREGVAYGLGELIDRHGQKDWLEPLIEALGPYIQLQLGDIANMLEVLAKSLLRMEGSGKNSVLPLFLPEWSFQYLRRQAQLAREEIIKHKVERIHFKEVAGVDSPAYTGHLIVPDMRIELDYRNSDDSDEDWKSAGSTASVLDEADIMSFRGRSYGVMGRLIIYSSGIRFRQSLTKEEMWNLPFLEMAEMRKSQGSIVSRLGLVSSGQLEFKSIDGSLIHVGLLKERDKVFNSIIGFSNLQWQSLQTGSAKHADEKTSKRG